MFKEITDTQDIILDDGRGKKVQQTMKMGQGKNRME